MIIIKVYETLINLSPPEMFQGDIDVVLMQKLQKLEGKCEKNTLITKIKEIIKRDDCRIIKSMLNGTSAISVQFRAEAIIYLEGSILVGCEVQKVEKGDKIICTYENAIINIIGNKNINSLRKGQKLIMRVLNVSYPKGKSNITILGQPYSYSFKFTVYLVKHFEIKAEEWAIWQKKLEEVKEELKLYDAVAKGAKKFFQDKLYIFKDKFSPDKLTTANIMEMPEKEDVYLMRHPIIPKEQPLVLRFTPKEFEAAHGSPILNPRLYDIRVVEENVVLVMLDFLNDFLNYIRAIREMTQVYSGEALDAHANLWQIYDNIKK